MKLIGRKEFIPTVCVIYTLLSLTKIILEAIVQKNYGVYQENLLTILFLSLLATFVLSQQYRFSQLPLLPVALLQYVLLIAAVMLLTWLSGLFTELHPDAYRDMFWSFTIPYVILAAVYYVSLLLEIKKANRLLKHFKEELPYESNR